MLPLWHLQELQAGIERFWFRVPIVSHQGRFFEVKSGGLTVLNMMLHHLVVSNLCCIMTGQYATDLSLVPGPTATTTILRLYCSCESIKCLKLWSGIVSKSECLAIIALNCYATSTISRIRSNLLPDSLNHWPSSFYIRSVILDLKTLCPELFVRDNMTYPWLS